MKKRESKGYCHRCDDLVPYHIEEVVETHYPKDRYIDVKILKPICDRCGREVVVESLEEENNIRIFDAQKKIMGLLTSDEIRAIRKKRHLSQTELSRLIGAGDKTVTRYENGLIQDKVFDTLIRLVDDDNGYNALLKLRNTYKGNTNNEK